MTHGENASNINGLFVGMYQICQLLETTVLYQNFRSTFRGCIIFQADENIFLRHSI